MESLLRKCAYVQPSFIAPTSVFMPTQHTKNPPRLALGLDPGIAQTGYAIIERFPNRYILHHSGMVYTSSREALGTRLNAHYKTIRELIAEHSPDLVSIEAVFFNKNISSCISTASVIAIAELAGTQAGIATFQVKPQAVKSAVTGIGTASKTAVKRMVNRLLAVEITSDHESDAAAAAIAGLLQPHLPNVP